MVYLDTSVAVALLTPEPRTADVRTWFAGLEDTPVASDWLIAEFASAVSIKLRRGELTEANAKQVHKEFDLLATSGLRLIPVSRGAFQRAAELAKQYRYGLRAADALHLAVALEAGANSVATLDGVMASNAKRLKLKVEAI
jgi:uncharacterized protein